MPHLVRETRESNAHPWARHWLKSLAELLYSPPRLESGLTRFATECYGKLTVVQRRRRPKGMCSQIRELRHLASMAVRWTHGLAIDLKVNVILAKSVHI